MRISDWSSDVCSSDLPESRHHAVLAGGGPGALWVALRLYPVQRAGCRAQSARRRIGFNPACIQKSLCARSEEHTSELKSLMRISYAVFCLKKKKQHNNKTINQLVQHTHPQQHSNS